MGLFILVILCVTFSFYGVDGGRSIFEREGLNLDGRHIVLEEPAAANKIQSSDMMVNGDFDCVDIYKQPAFAHPLLKNHKIQTNPNFSESWMTNKVLLNSEVAKMDPPQSFIKVKSVSLDTSEVTTYHGAKKRISIQNPHVELGQYSKAQIWLQNGPAAETNCTTPIPEPTWAINSYTQMRPILLFSLSLCRPILNLHKSLAQNLCLLGCARQVLTDRCCGRRSNVPSGGYPAEPLGAPLPSVFAEVGTKFQSHPHRFPLPPNLPLMFDDTGLLATLAEK